MSSSQLNKLLQPVRIGSLEVRNRMVMPAMVPGYGSAEGFVTQRSLAYYEARAKGGVGLIIVETTCVQVPVGRVAPGQLVIADDRYLPGLSQLAATIKKHGARAAIQLNHGGNAARPGVPGVQPVAPSAVTRTGYDAPRELTIDEIEQLITCYSSAAERARSAGFDGVEIHGAHMYLIAQFLSRVWNRRDDLYGGSLENRAHFLLQVLTSIREKVGRDFPVWSRLNGAEFGIEGGITIDETVQVAVMAENAGADALHISGWYATVSNEQAWSMPTVPGNLVSLAAAVKEAVRVPVIAVGRLNPHLGEKILAEGKADLIAMGRALIADPELPRKAIEGRLEDIIPCTSCYGCNQSVHHGSTGLRCQVNAATGQEWQPWSSATARPRRVLVIGGGPAGMEVAHVASLRSHDVLLYEKEFALGGQLLQAIMPPHKERLKPFLDYLIRQLYNRGVRIELGTEVTQEVVKTIAPDVVVLATGTRPSLPDIPGVDSSHVVLVADVLEGRRAVGQKVVVIGGGLVGCETAEFLADRGKLVTVVEQESEIATKVSPPFVRELLLRRLDEKGVVTMPGALDWNISASGLVVTTHEGERLVLEADNIVVAVGARPNRELEDSLRQLVPEIHVVGDCGGGGDIMEAIAGGYLVGMEL